MSLDEFDGLKISRSKLTIAATLISLALILYGGLSKFNRMEFEIERLRELNTQKSSEIAALGGKIEAQTVQITQLKIAVARLADHLESQK